MFAPSSKHRVLVTPTKRGRGNKVKVSDKLLTPTERRAAVSWVQRLKRDGRDDTRRLIGEIAVSTSRPVGSDVDSLLHDVSAACPGIAVAFSVLAKDAFTRGQRHLRAQYDAQSRVVKAACEAIMEAARNVANRTFWPDLVEAEDSQIQPGVASSSMWSSIQSTRSARACRSVETPVENTASSIRLPFSQRCSTASNRSPSPEESTRQS